MENERTDAAHLLYGHRSHQESKSEVAIMIASYMVGIWYKFGQTWKPVNMSKLLKVRRMGLPVVENLSGLCDNIFGLVRSPQLHLNKKSKKDRFLY